MKMSGGFEAALSSHDVGGGRIMTFKMEKSKRVRRPNFLPEEVDMLISSLEERRELVTGEVGGIYATSSDLKRAWEEVTDAVNAVGCMRRATAEIKDKWMCLKCRTKKKAQLMQRKLEEQEATKREPLTPAEERVIDLIGRALVYGLSPQGVPETLHCTPPKSTTSTHSDEIFIVPDKVLLGNSPHYNGEVSIKSESRTDGSSTEPPCSSNQGDDSSTLNEHLTNPPQSLLKDILERQQLMLDAWAGFQESIDMHNRIQKGILCMKYMKLKLLADERNLEVVLPPEIESLLTDSTED